MTSREISSCLVGGIFSSFGGAVDALVEAIALAAATLKSRGWDVPKFMLTMVIQRVMMTVLSEENMLWMMK